MTLEPLILKMISYDHGSPERIQHFLKVHSFAKTIAVSEHLDEKTLFITEVHLQLIREKTILHFISQCLTGNN